MQKNYAQDLAKISHTKDILLLFSVPLGIALLVGLFVYVPGLLARPAYSFVYSYCTDYASCTDSYSLDASGHLTKQVTPTAADQVLSGQTHLALYDTPSGSSKMLTYDEAKSYSYINSSKAPDGYILEHKTSDGGFLLWANYHDNWQLTKGIQHKSVHLNGSDNPGYNQNIMFIGWVQK